MEDASLVVLLPGILVGKTTCSLLRMSSALTDKDLRRLTLRGGGRLQ